MKIYNINLKDLKTRFLSNVLYLIIILSLLLAIVYIVQKNNKNEKTLSISRTIFGTEIVNENLKIVITNSVEGNTLRGATVVLNNAEEDIVVSSNLNIISNKVNESVYHLDIEKYGEFNEEDKITISRKDGTILLKTSLKQ